MAGHSKWANISRQKAINDAKKGKVFTKLSRDITLAAREGGGDINLNVRLKLEVDKAKAMNMPAENISRAIKKGTGEINSEETLQQVTYEAYGPGGTALIIEAETDNLNRTVTEVRTILNMNSGKLVEGGGIAWMFETRGLIVLSPQRLIPSNIPGSASKYETVDIEQLTLEVMDIKGVEDIIDIDDGGAKLALTVDKERLHDIRIEISAMDYKIDSTEIVQMAREEIEITPEEVEELSKLLGVLYDSMDVQNVWHNARSL